MDDFKRKNFWPFYSSASGPTGGHWKALGFTYAWITPDVYAKLSFDFLGLIAFEKYNDGPLRWAFGKFSITFRPGYHRFGEREKAKMRRAAKRRVRQLQAQ